MQVISDQIQTRTKIVMFSKNIQVISDQVQTRTEDKYIIVIKYIKKREKEMREEELCNIQTKNK